MTERVTLADLTISACDEDFRFLALSNSMADIDGSRLFLCYRRGTVCSFAFYLPPFGVTGDPDGGWINRGHMNANWKTNPEYSSPM